MLLGDFHFSFVFSFHVCFFSKVFVFCHESLVVVKYLEEFVQN